MYLCTASLHDQADGRILLGMHDELPEQIFGLLQNCDIDVNGQRQAGGREVKSSWKLRIAPFQQLTSNRIKQSLMCRSMALSYGLGQKNDQKAIDHE